MNDGHAFAFWFFLGGRDLEMVAIRELVERAAPGQFTDHSAGWGAKASDYCVEIESAFAAGYTPVLVELALELPLATGKVLIVDHHGPLAGANAPTSLEQVFRLLERPQAEWTRWYELVAANDRGHVRGMQRVGATQAEMIQVRAADRSAQGITANEESLGKAAAIAAVAMFDGRLTVVRLPHGRTATVTDALTRELGGPGYENLLILCPDETAFFGGGSAVVALDRTFPGGWTGGELPERGYWGHPSQLPLEAVFPLLGTL